MHKAAFVLPTFAKRELEAYCTKAETVSSLQIVTSDDFKNISQANSTDSVHHLTGGGRGNNSGTSTKANCGVKEWNSHHIITRPELATQNRDIKKPFLLSPAFPSIAIGYAHVLSSSRNCKHGYRVCGVQWALTRN